VRTAEELQAVYAEFARNPRMDISALKIELDGNKPALEHASQSDPDPKEPTP
jgi:hypothetical protein